MGAEALPAHPDDLAVAELPSGARIAFDDRVCLACQVNTGVRLVPSQTQYSWDGVGRDPNADIPLCETCAADHRVEMNARWREYYRDRL